MFLSSIMSVFFIIAKLKCAHMFSKIISGKGNVTNAYLARLFHFNGYDMVSVTAELTSPGTSLTDPLQQTQLMCVPNGSITSAGI